MISQEGEGAAFTKSCTFLEAAYYPNLLEAKTSLSESNNASQLSRADDSLDGARMNRTTLFLISISTPLLCTVETTAARDLSSTPQFSSFREAPRSFCERSYLRKKIVPRLMYSPDLD